MIVAQTEADANFLASETPNSFFASSGTSPTTAEFIEAFRAGHDIPSGEPVRIRLLPPKGAPGNAKIHSLKKNYDFTLDKLESNAFLRSQNEDRGVYFVVNIGGHSDEDITTFTAVFAENDHRSIEDQHSDLDNAPLPPSIRVETRKSVHAYWLLTTGTTKNEWLEIQRRLIAYFGSDPSISNPSRVMRVPGFDHLHRGEHIPKHRDGDGIEIPAETVIERKKIVVTHFNPELRYNAEQLFAAFPEATTTRTQAVGKLGARQMPSRYTDEKWTISEDRKIHRGYGTTAFIASQTGYWVNKFARGVDRVDRVAAMVTLDCQRMFAVYDCEIEEEIYSVAESMADNSSERYDPNDPIDDETPITDDDLFVSFDDDPVKYPTPEYIIHGAARGDLMSLISVSNFGKSTIVRNLVMSLATGKPYLTLSGELGKKRRVMLLDYETSIGFYLRDGRLMMSDERFTDEDRADIARNVKSIVAKRRNGKAFDLSNNDDWRELVERAERFKPDVIVLDTVTQAFNFTNENDNSEVTRTLKKMQSLATNLDCVVLFTHHEGKGGEGSTGEAVYKARGGSAFGGVPPCVVRLTKNNEQRVLSFGKIKDDTPRDVALILNDHRLYEDSGEDVVQKADLKSQPLIDLLQLPGYVPMNRTEIRTALGGDKPLSKSTLSAWEEEIRSKDEYKIEVIEGKLQPLRLSIPFEAVAVSSNVADDAIQL